MEIKENNRKPGNGWVWPVIGIFALIILLGLAVIARPGDTSTESAVGTQAGDVQIFYSST